MSYTIRPAQRAEAKPLIGIYSESGCGKTYSALILARGFVGPSGKILMIETESGRGEAFADPKEYPEIGGYDVISMRDNFSPEEYGKAITSAEQAKVDALIMDSASHEWESAGGVLDMAAKNQADGKKGVLVWQQPKMLHQRHFMLRLLATSIPLVVVNMRAKYPMVEKAKAGGGKEWVRSESLEPKQSEDILFEMFLHGWIDKLHAFHLSKATTRSISDVFEDGQPITVQTGERLRAWARGQAPATQPLGKIGAKWGAGVTAAVAGAKSLDELEDVVARANQHMLAYKEWNAEKWADLQELIRTARAELTPKDQQQPPAEQGGLL